MNVAAGHRQKHRAITVRDVDDFEGRAINVRTGAVTRLTEEHLDCCPSWQRVPSSVPSSTSATAVPQAGEIVATTPFHVAQTELYAARSDGLYVLVIPPGNSSSITLMHLKSDGTTSSRAVPFDLGYYLMNVSAGPLGVYAGTAVVKRFTARQDVLIRIDPATLTIEAHAAFPASVAPLQQEQGLWATIGDGRVVSLDPNDLVVRASQQVVPAAAAATDAASLSAPALGLGSLWVLAGDGSNLQLVRMDPLTLDILSETKVPTAGDLYQELKRVVADPDHVYLAGVAVVSVAADGGLIGRPVVVPGLDGAEIYGSDLIGVIAGRTGVSSLARFRGEDPRKDRPV